MQSQIQELVEKINLKESSIADVSQIAPENIDTVEKIQETVDQLHSQLESFEYEEQQQHNSLQRSLAFETSSA